jgi:dihydrofolate reductase
MSGRVHVFAAISLDGYLAGEDHDLSWLPGADPAAQAEAKPADDGGYAALLAEVGALLMGRQTYDVLCGFAIPWPYGDLPVLVATHRPLSAAAPTVRAAAGSVQQLMAAAQQAAQGRDVYIDGGQLIRQAMDAGLVDTWTLAVVPTLLTRGQPLWAGLKTPQTLVLRGQRQMANGLLQLRLATDAHTPAPAWWQ